MKKEMGDLRSFVNAAFEHLHGLLSLCANCLFNCLLSPVQLPEKISSRVAQIKSWTVSPRCGRRNRWFPSNGGSGAGGISGSRELGVADGNAEHLLRHRVRSAHGLRVEGPAQRVWQRQRGAPRFSELAEGGVLSQVVAYRQASLGVTLWLAT